MVRVRQPATLADLEALPDHVRGEVIDGVLYMSPRPSFTHMYIVGQLVTKLSPAYMHAVGGGPGGWWIVPEPGIAGVDAVEFSPDLAGWRRARMPEPPDGRVQIVPDWLCEVVSPSNARYDLTTKKAYYARLGVPHIWYVDGTARVVTVSELRGGQWVELGAFGDGETMRAKPFDAVEIDVGSLWPTPAEPMPDSCCCLARRAASSAISWALPTRRFDPVRRSRRAPC